MTERSRCPCGIVAKDPWGTRETPYSPASFAGGVLWLAAGATFLLTGFELVALLLCCSTLFLVGISLSLQAIKRHWGGCLLRRGLWFGLAAQGLPLRIAYWLNL
jgi:hypothetical protein